MYFLAEGAQCLQAVFLLIKPLQLNPCVIFTDGVMLTSGTRHEQIWLLCGGLSGSQTSPGLQVWCFTCSDAQWRQCKASNPVSGPHGADSKGESSAGESLEFTPPPRRDCCAAVINYGRWFIHGGSAADGSTLSDAATFEFSTCRWTEVLLSNPEAPASCLHTDVRSS